MEFDKKQAFYLQIIESIKIDILSGRIGIGEKLPTLKEAGLFFDVNPNTIQKAYGILETEGIIRARKGSGVYVCADEMKLAKLRKDIAEKTMTEAVKKIRSIGYNKKEMLKLFDDIMQKENVKAG